MAVDGSSLSPKLRTALMETFADPLRTQVYVAVYERPGATVAQVSRRLDEPAGRIQRQIDRLIGAGLVVVETGTQGRGVRECHHRGVVVPTLDEGDDPWTEVCRRDLSLSAIKYIAADIGRAIRGGTFGNHPGHAEVRIPGEVDERGWAEIGAIVTEAMGRAEAILVAGAARLQAAGKSGIEVISALLFFEAPAWEGPAEGREGPRPSRWSPSASGAYETFEAKTGSRRMSPVLRDALVESLADTFRARVLFAVAERPGATIAQIAARIGEPPRRVRHQIERLVESGLIVVDGQTQRRNARERHYRAVALPAILEEDGDAWPDGQRRRIASSIIRTIMVDLDGALRGETLGARPGHAVVRIPGEVDERGWAELAVTTVRATEAIEAAMVRSGARLEDERRPGIEVISALLLFEALPWERDEVDSGPRPTHWTAHRQARGR
jgi:DNA-binding transcriptional ArsR family regulator